MKSVYVDLNAALHYLIEARTYALQNIQNQKPNTDRHENAIRGALAFEIAIEAMQECQRRGYVITRQHKG